MKVDFNFIAETLNVTRPAVVMRATRENWPFTLEAVRGGQRKLFALADLPPKVAREVQRHIEINKRAEVSQAVTDAITRIKADAAAEAAEKRARGEANLTALLADVPDGVKNRFDYRYAVVRAWETWFAASQPIRRNASFEAFAGKYNARQIDVDASVLAVLPDVSARSVRRWVLDYERNGMAGLVDNLDGKARKGVNVFTTQPALEKVTLALLIARPHLGLMNLLDLIRQAAIDPKTGEHLFNVPSYAQVKRFVGNWKARNAEVFIAATNPDQWKNSHMVAFGDASADVVRLNQRWEMDATPADWMLTDEDGRKRRYSASAVVDVYSRRMLFVLAPTPKTETHKYALRAALLAWGVPEEIVTDNGKDYQSRDFQETLRQLGIHQHTTAPFSPWEKPHVERGIQTMLHSNLEALEAFVGHNVAERSAIEARKSFADRLFNKGEVIEMALPGRKLQALINDWVAGQYEHRPHGGLGEKTPFEVATAYTGDVARIQNERHLDLLLAQPAGKGSYVVTKKGLTIEGAKYIAPELAVLVRQQVAVRQTADLGELVVYHEGTFVCVAVCPERTGVSREEIAAHARQLQNAHIQKKRREIKAFKVDPDQLVESLLRSKAEAAGKLAALPQRTVAHETEALAAAGAAHRSLSGHVSAAPIPADLQRIMDKRKQEATAVQEPKPSNVHAVPETPQLRFRKWLELDAHLNTGGAIDDPLLIRWYASYQQSPEFPGLKKRYEGLPSHVASEVTQNVRAIR